MHFIFLRHSIYQQPKGVPSALLPHPITDEGVEQAQKAAETLIQFFEHKPEKIPDCIESSCLLRAYQTAEIIAETLGQKFSKTISIVETDQLVERSMGAMANLDVETIEKILSKDKRYESPPEGWKSSADYKLPYIGAESLSEAGIRVSNYIKNPPSAHCNWTPEKYRLLVGHGASFRHACAQMGILKKEDIPKLSMYYAAPLFFEENNGVWNKIEGEWKIRNRKDAID